MGGGFQDIALVKQAQRELRGIRNALEEYKIDHGSYPSQGTDLKVSLAPYLSKAFYSEGEEVTEYARIVLGAKNNLTQIRSALSGCARISEPRIKELFSHIQESLVIHENVLNGKDEEIRSIEGDISKMQIIIDDLRPLELKSLAQDSLLRVTTQIIGAVDSLIQGTQGDELKHLQNIGNTFKWYETKLLGKKPSEEVELYSPEAEIAALKEISESPSYILILEELINSYYELESSRDYYEFLLITQKDIGRALKLVSILDGKMGEARKAGVIVQAQASLRRMADAIRDYRRKSGRFPEEGANIDSILHPYFVETTMSGERIDRWQDALSWFSSGPVYKTKNPDLEFELEARVNDEFRTPILSKVKIENKWSKIVEAFSGPLIYTTPDSTLTYFLKARANDSGLTWVTERPPIRGE